MIISVHCSIWCFHSTSQLQLHKHLQLSFFFNQGTLKVSSWSPQEPWFPIHGLHSEGSNNCKFTHTALTTTSVLN